MEQWCKIKNYEYEVSTRGRVRNIVTGKILKSCIDGNGYFTVFLSKRGQRGKTHKIHRLLMVYFVPKPEGKSCVNHINGIKSDNRFENLEWVTYSENTTHAVALGLLVSCKGVSHGRSKLTETDVINMRTIYKDVKLITLAMWYGVSNASVSLIRNRKTWTHI